MIQREAFGFKAWTVALLIVSLATFAVLLTEGDARSADTSCKGGERSTIDVGIARANACWTRTGTGDKTVYTAKWADQPVGVGVDLNGFVLGRAGERGGAGIKFNPATGDVESDGDVRMYSRNWPATGLNSLGAPFRLEFTAPKPTTSGDAEMVIEDMRISAPVVFRGILAGIFSPALNVEAPMTIYEDGKGSIGLTVQLSGIFTLKGKAQSATIDFVTELGKGTTWDGFSLELNEIDAFNAVILQNFSAYYSASKEAFGGEASVRFPFTPQEKLDREGKGITAGFGVTKGRLTNVKFGVVGLKIPIGSAGFLTSIAGGGNWAEPPNFSLDAALGAEFGPDMPVPSSAKPVAPIGVNGALKFGYRNQEVYFRVDAGMSLFNIPLGSAYIGIYTKTGVEFGAGIGIGVPSLRDRPSDPFYLGARVDGWIAKGRFQFTGSGRIRVFNVPLLDAQAMVSSSVIGACAKMFWFDAGAVYTFRTKSTEMFGKSCGLDRYKEKFPGALVSGSAANPRSFSLGGREAALEVSGRDGAPRFTLKSASGDLVQVPVTDDGVKRDDNAVFVDEEEDVTTVFLKDPKGQWEITPYPDSPPITGLKAGRPLPEEQVEARVVGRGTKRTLVWDTNGQPNTTLSFSEVMNGGVENPLLTTGKASGSKRIKVEADGLYGQRKLRVVVLHGDAPREEEVVDRYVVKRPPRPKAPGKVRAWRNEQNATVTWSKVMGATNYFIQVRLPKSKTWEDSFVRLVGHRSRRVLIESFPSGGVARARVIAINRDGRFGRPGAFSFRTDPRRLKLRAAAVQGVRSARREGNGIGLRTICGTGGHCDLRIRLLRGERLIGYSRFQQTPDTFRHLKVRPRSKALRKRLARGRLGKLRIVITEARNGKTVTVSRKV